VDMWNLCGAMMRHGHVMWLCKRFQVQLVTCGGCVQEVVLIALHSWGITSFDLSGFPLQ
jgi:hypothetical protein